MNNSAPDETCPFTGLAIITKPEWTKTSSDNSFRQTISLVGERILVQKFSGYIDLKNAENCIKLLESVWHQMISKELSIVILQDFTDSDSISQEGHIFLINTMKQYLEVKYLIFYGLKPFAKMSLKLGKSVHRFPYEIGIVNTYDEAILIAKNILFGNSVKKIKSLNDSAVYSKFYNTNVLTIQFEVINGNILHVIQKGLFQEEDIVPSIKLQKEVAEFLVKSSGPFYFILGVNNFKWANRKTRSVYMQQGIIFFKNFPFKIFFIYGINRYQRSVLNVTQPFMPIKFRIVDNLEIAKASINNNKKNPFRDKKIFNIHKSGRWSKEVLEYLESINWETGEKVINREDHSSHPLRQIFDAIDILRWDFNELLNERKIYEETLQKALVEAEAANHAKSLFLASMNHELRTPLNSIIGFSELLKEKCFGELNEKQCKSVRDIYENGQHLLSLVSNILDLSSIDAGKMELEMEKVMLFDLLEESLMMVRESCFIKNINLELNNVPKEKGLSILADKNKLIQIIHNLLSNAVKFTPDGGEIRVTTVIKDLEITISVIDTGIGLSEKDKYLILGKFYQVKGGYINKSSGTGLGLNLAKNLIEMHGGHLHVESPGVGKGSCFSFTMSLN